MIFDVIGLAFQFSDRLRYRECSACTSSDIRRACDYAHGLGVVSPLYIPVPRILTSGIRQYFRDLPYCFADIRLSRPRSLTTVSNRVRCSLRVYLESFTDGCFCDMSTFGTWNLHEDLYLRLDRSLDDAQAVANLVRHATEEQTKQTHFAK